MAESDRTFLEPLDSDNYSTWALKMRFLLQNKSLWTAIKPAAGVPVDPAVDQKALSIIELNDRDHHLSTVGDCNTAKEAWDKFESIYKSNSIARQLELRKKLNAICKEPSEPLPQYIARAKALWGELRACGVTLTEADIVAPMLAGLPSEYDTVIAILENSTAELQLDSALTALLRVEARTQHTGKAAAYLSRANNNRKKPTSSAHSNPPEQRRAPSSHSEGNKHAKYRCHNCGEKGHIARNCPTKRGGAASSAGGAKS
jgi:hypothetical protein